jgi:hypothetical protein
MNVRVDVQKRFADEAATRLSQTIPARPDCFTYFKDANGRITTQWPGYALEYRIRTRAVRAADFEFA